jgi:hypothetical protein
MFCSEAERNILLREEKIKFINTDDELGKLDGVAGTLGVFSWPGHAKR